MGYVDKVAKDAAIKQAELLKFGPSMKRLSEAHVAAGYLVGDNVLTAGLDDKYEMFLNSPSLWVR